MTNSDKKAGERPRFPRYEPKLQGEVAEGILLEHLHEAVLLIDKGGPEAREGIMEAIEAVMIFLNERGVSGQQIWPFGLLRKELNSIFEGNRSLILQPGVNSKEDLLGRRHAGHGKDEIRIYAVACAEARYRLGKTGASGYDKLTRKEADIRVASQTRNWPAFDTGDITGRTIKGWRDRLDEGGDKDKLDGLLEMFTKDEIGHSHLREVLKSGPFLTGGFRKK